MFKRSKEIARDLFVSGRFFLPEVLILALMLRLYNLCRFPLWFDEAAAAMEPRGIFSLPGIWQFLDAGFSSNRADYLMFYCHGFVHYWKALAGDCVFGLRISSVFWGVAGVFMAYKLAGYLSGKPAARAAALLLAIAPFHIYFSQELRQYSAILFLSLSAFYFLFRILDGAAVRNWVYWAALNTVNIYFHYMMFFLLAAQVLLLFAYRRRLKISPLAMIACAGSLILLFPALLTVFQKTSYILTHDIRPDISDYPIWAGSVDPRTLLYTLRDFSIGYTLDAYSLPALTAVVFMSGLFIAGIVCLKYEKGFYGTAAAVLFIFPLLALFLVSLMLKPCYVDRYLFPLGGLFCICAGIGIHAAGKRYGALLLAAAFIFSAVGLVSYYRDDMPADNRQHVGYMRKNTAINAVVPAITAQYRPEDQIFCASRLIILPFKFYTRAYLRNYLPVPKGLLKEAMEGKMLWIGDDAQVYQLFYNKIMPTWYDKAPFLIAPGSRIWVIQYKFDRRPEVIEYMSGQCILRSILTFGNSEVYLFEKR